MVRAAGWRWAFALFGVLGVAWAAVLSFIQGVGSGAIRSGTSIFAALGEVIVQRAGIVNLGVEGCMLVGACAGFIVAFQTGNPYVALLVAGTLLIAYWCVRLPAAFGIGRWPRVVWS